jgi:hypothetical protein
MIRIVFFILFLIPLTGLHAQNKKALIVAIGNYPSVSGFRSINSINDIPIIQNALLKLGFKENNIQIITEEAATKKNIVSALENDFLKSLQPGDIAYFHFSGHGQQVIDLNGDELDGLDEALVPYDALAEFVPGIYEGQNHLIDDDLSRIYSKIRIALGPKGHFLATIDACHSGTSTRHIGCARGTDIILAPPGFNNQRNEKKQDLSQSETQNADESKMASMVALFGSTASQLNYEIQAEDGKNYGALSYAFSKAVNSIPSDASYQQLFDRIRLIIQSNSNNQIPEASGILAQPVLGGKYLGTPNYFSVREWQNKNTVVIEAGFLNGITSGTVIGFYPPETREISNAIPIATGVIKEAAASKCIAEITQGISMEDALHSWVIVKEENFGNLQIQLQLRGEFKSVDPDIWKEIFELPYIKKTDTSADLVLIDDPNKIVLVNKFDNQIAEFSHSSSRSDFFYKLKSALTQYGQSQFLRKLNQENKQIAIEFKLILVARNGIQYSETTQPENLNAPDGKISFKEGDQVKIKVTNTGSKPAYYSLLDIQPNNQTNVLFPQANESPSDYYLIPDASFIIPKVFRLDPPLGQELFKLVATKNPVNLRPLDQRRGMGDDSDKDPFAKMIKLSYYKDDTLLTRGITSNVPAGQVNIYSVPFVIEK